MSYLLDTPIGYNTTVTKLQLTAFGDDLENSTLRFSYKEIDENGDSVGVLKSYNVSATEYATYQDTIAEIRSQFIESAATKAKIQVTDIRHLMIAFEQRVCLLLADSAPIHLVQGDFDEVVNAASSAAGVDVLEAMQAALYDIYPAPGTVE